ncbi:hypothetical protein [Pseudozobellia thermophila]|uniref:DUF4190 domain-containing protein n=1 Tax=Pseudozobellia thermophila TaxID=192903 RepID=A0A1M6EPA8_9FLAO|nr:hypothetical protein [Pseudozobellia thermophila]SHI87110.1 hypothetical protein SAMN04488513_102125 [Pseudozobellia thermophila]
MNDASQANENQKDKQGQTIIITRQESKSNGTGTAGFVLALIALFLGWIPFLGWILWLLGVILSIIGLFKKPRGLAIAGVIISFLGLILLLLVFAGLAVLGTAASL